MDQYGRAHEEDTDKLLKLFHSSIPTVEKTVRPDTDSGTEPVPYSTVVMGSVEREDPYQATIADHTHLQNNDISEPNPVNHYNDTWSDKVAGDTTPSGLNHQRPTALQQHVLYWDRDNDNIIHPHDVYTGFRELGFSIPFSIGSLLIPLFFSYPTRLGHSFLPDPFFRIYVNSIHKAKHGSDTGIYDSDGCFRPRLFDEMFAKFDGSGTRSLGVSELFWLIKKNRVVMDPAGWSFAFMEWSTTWLLLQRKGRVWKDDLRQCYDGSLFWRIREERLKGEAWNQGYGWKDFFRSIAAGGPWREWKLE